MKPSPGQPRAFHFNASLSMQSFHAYTNMKTYCFYIETIDGARIEWRGLTIKKARDMHSWTERRMPDNVRVVGWEEEESK